LDVAFEIADIFSHHLNGPVKLFRSKRIGESPMSGRIVFIAAFSSLTLAGTVFGHDYWLVPQPPHAMIGREVVVRLFRGEAPKADDERPYEARMTERFSLFCGQEERDLKGTAKDGASPVTWIIPKTEGG
jgi:hypothetical protein